MQSTTLEQCQAETAAAMMQMNIINQTTTGLNAHQALIHAYGVREMHKHLIQEMLNGGASATNGISALIQQSVQKLEGLLALELLEITHGLQIRKCCLKTSIPAPMEKTTTEMEKQTARTVTAQANQVLEE